MISWRDFILNDFIPNITKLTLVADPDSLLTEEILCLELRDRGFDLIEFDDPIEFRYAYESKYRALWDRGERTDLVVILRLKDGELGSLPYDLLKAGRTLSYNLGILFPNLSYPIIEKLDRSLLDALFDAQKKFSPGRMGESATKDFVLRHVFGIAAELIKDDVDLLRSLLRLHYNKISIPSILSERLVQVLQSNGSFQDWPIDEIVTDEKSFFGFVQERWPLFLSERCGIRFADDDSSIAKNTIQETQRSFIPPIPDLFYPGPDIIPFEHQDIRVYIDNLFVEGRLSPVHGCAGEHHAGAWFMCGLVETSCDNGPLRISRFFKSIEENQPMLESRHSDWATFSMKWAELSSLVHSGSDEADKRRLRETGDKLNQTFSKWLFAHYSSLINLPPSNPVMLHHVPRRMARSMEDNKNGRVALLVIDGLSLDQWVTVRNVLQEQDNRLVMRESAVYAWIPTLTSVSRQSIFSGKAPIHFPASIHSTDNEGNLWKQFWESHGVSRSDIAYLRGLGDGDVARVLDAVQPGQTKVLGLVVDKVDKIMHGMQLGSAGMHNQIKQWCEEGFLKNLVTFLLDYEYDVWLTSDHGNIECIGKGRPSEGVIAETRGERVRVYPTPELRSHISKAFSFAHEWQPVGLPLNYFPLVAGSRDGFVNPGVSIVGHGGIAIEEVIVPLVKFERKIR